MRIYAGVPWRGGVKRQWGNRKRRFSGLSDATSSATSEMRPTLLNTVRLQSHLNNSSSLEVFLNGVRYMNPRFTYLLTYLLTIIKTDLLVEAKKPGCR